jgi:hypothetical protein
MNGETRRFAVLRDAWFVGPIVAQLFTPLQANSHRH